MGKNQGTGGNFEELRRKAAGRVKDASTVEDISRLSLTDVQNLVHELQVHQAELEVQNEELRRAQVELEESRDRYVELYEFSPVGFFTLDRKGTILRVNLSGAVMVGYERSLLAKKPFSVLVAAADRNVFFSHLKRALNTDVRQTCELALETPGDRQIQVRLESIVRSAESDMVTCFTAVSDISEPHRLRMEVLTTQEKILSNMVEGVCVCDGTGVIQFANTALEKMFRYAKGGLIGLHLGALDCETGCHAVRPRQHMEMLGHAVDKGSYRGELMCRRRDGTTFQADVRAMGFELFAQETVVCIWEDVTALRQAERTVIESEQRFRAVFEGATDLISVKDRSLRYTQVNPAFEKLVRKTAAAIIGMRHEDLFGADGAEYAQDVDARVLAGETIEEEHTRKVNGALLWFHEVRIPMRDVDGSVTGICTIARDVSERHARETRSQHQFSERVSKAMEKTLALAEHVARRDSIVLIKGESGSGKDYLARYIHDRSHRSGGPYFSLNCAAISPSLAESELFGHERGAFTGAHSRKRGLLELAEGGTLLLNEIGELPLPLQAKLLTFLDTKKFTRVGGEKEISVNARLLSATNRDLEQEVEAGRFRQDLFYRLNVMAITVPPLRERLEDIPELVSKIVASLAAELQLAHPPEIDSTTMRRLTQYDWPGNIRELRNVLERTLILGDAPRLPTTDVVPEPCGDDCCITLSCGPNRTLRDLTDELTRSMCVEALRRCHGNKKEAARMLGIARDSLYRHLKHFGIEAGPETD